MSIEKAFRGTEKTEMKTILPLLVVACLGLVAVGCDPAPKDEANANAPVADKPTAAMLGTKAEPPKR